MLFTPDDFKQIGDGSSNFLKEVAESALTNACSLYAQFPTSYGIQNPVGDSIQKFSSSVWDSLCGQLPNPSLPTPPTRPFEGGQCCDKTYVINITYTRQFWDYGNVENGPVTGPFTVQGQPGAGRILSVSKNSEGTGVVVTTESCAGATFSQTIFNDGAYKILSLSASVAPTDGSPDTCGSLPASYPSTPAPSTNPFTYPYVGNDGVQRDIPYEINFSPTVNGPTLNFPDFPNLCASFEAFGVDIDLCTNKPPDGGGGGISPEDLQRLLDAADKVDDIKDDVDDLGRKRTPSVEPKGEKENDSEEDTGELYGILVEISFIPTGTGREFGQPQKFDFGRAYFKRGTFYSEEIPLATIRQWLPAHPDSTGYAVSFRKGVKANITVIKPPTE